MHWTCPKCGKKLDISNKQLIARDGLIVCPQCLLQARQPLPKSSSPDEPPEYEPKPKATPPERNRMASPPPYRPRMKTNSLSSTVQNDNTASTARTAPKRSASKKKSRKKGKKDGIGGWGCLGLTVVFTLVLFAAYVFFGLLLEALQ